MSNKNLVTDALKSYISHPSSNAILLKGPWGSGKTYFWEQYANENLKNRSVSYVSLFGVTNGDKLKSKILMACATESKKGSKRDRLGAKIIEGVASIKEPIKNLGIELASSLTKKYTGQDIKPYLDALNITLDPLTLLPSDVVICLDDLERSTVPYKELLGIINEIVEHNGNKVVILSADEKIDDNEYVEFKEKIIRHSIKFENSIPEILEFLIKKNSSTLQKSLSSKRHVIEKVFSDLECKNIRTLQKTVDKIISLYLKNTDTLIPDEDIAYLAFLSISDSELPLFDFETMKAQEGSWEDAKKDKTSTRHQDLYEKMNFGIVSLSRRKMIFTFVKDGVLDTADFNLEYFPPQKHESPSLKVLRENHENPWWTQSEKVISERLKKVEGLLKKSIKEDINVIAKLLIVGATLAAVLKKEKSFLDNHLNHAQRLIEKNTSLESRSMLFHEDVSLLSKESTEAIRSLMEKVSEYKKNIKAKDFVLTAWADLKKHGRSELYDYDSESFSGVVETISSEKYTQALLKKRKNRYYFITACAALRYIIQKNANHKDYPIAKEKLDSFLTIVYNTSTDAAEKLALEKIVGFPQQNA